MNRVSFVVFVLLCWGLPGLPGVAAAEPLRLVYSSNNRGEVDPCG